jgi:hypothetical protein
MPRENPFTNSEQSKTIGKSDSKSGAKAKSSSEGAINQLKSVDSESWPRGEDGKPMAKLTMTAAELIPTGQYANASIGPAQITVFVDLSKAGTDSYYSDAEKGVLAMALNELAEVVEADVVSVQRNLVLESMQSQVSS